MGLSDADLKNLTEKVDSLLYKNDPGESIEEVMDRLREILRCLDILILNEMTNGQLFFRRFLVKRRLGQDDALDDISMAIELDSARPGFYVHRGLYLLEQAHNKAKKAEIEIMSFGKKEDHKEIWEPFSKIIPKVKDDFNTALHKDPTLSKVWLGAIACALLQNDWDEAISLCGESVPFVSDAALKADRAWYLCLALTFAGDTVTDEEKTASEDAKTTKSGLESKISSVPRLGEMVFEHLANEIHYMKEESIQEKQKKNDFLDILLKPALAQYDNHSPIFGNNRIWPLLYQKANLLFHLGRYNEELDVRQLIIHSLYPGAWIDLSNCLGRLSRYPEALEAAEKAIGYGAASSEAWLEKGMHFEAMSRFEDALQAYTKAADPNPENYRYSSTLPIKKREASYCLCKKVALLVRLERYLEGLKVLEQLFSLWPESLMMEQIDEIIGRIPPSDVNDLSEAWYLKARVFAFNGDRDNANFYLTKTIGINPRKRNLAPEDELLKDLLEKLE